MEIEKDRMRICMVQQVCEVRQRHGMRVNRVRLVSLVKGIAVDEDGFCETAAKSGM